MVFVLTGVVHQSNARRFTFEAGRNGSDRARIVVDVDLELARKYGIPLQELPLLCLHLLDGRTGGAGETIKFAESEMIGYANRRIEANASAERKRRARRTPKSNLVGQAWRTAGK